MEITCTRCHQTVQPGDCFCPVCGLPQLVYDGESTNEQSQPDKWNELVRDAGSIDWKPALRYAVLLGMPAGILASLLAGAGYLSLLLMGVTGALVVVLYMRNRRPSWITLGAGARLGLVTGLLGGWTAILAFGVDLYAARYWFHQGPDLDTMFTKQINDTVVQLTNLGMDSQKIALYKQFLFSPEARAGGLISGACILAIALLVFAVAGAAISTRILARTRRPQS